MDTQTNIPTPSFSPQNQMPTFSFPTAGKLLSQAEEIYKTKFKALILISLCSVGVAGITNLIVAEGEKYIKSSSGTESIVSIVLSVLVFLLVAYMSVWAFAATIRNINSPDAGSSAGQSFSESSHDVMPLILTGLLTFLFVFGGMILLVIPGIIFSFWYSQSSYIVLTEGLTAKKAMDRSKFYVQGNIWEIFKKGFYIGLISIILSLAVGFIFNIAGKAISASFMPIIGSLLFQLFWTPLASIYAFLMFQYLRQSKASATPPTQPASSNTPVAA